MVHFENYLVISYIFYVFILQKGELFSQSRRVKFQKFSGPSAPTMVWSPLDSKQKNLKVFKSANLATMRDTTGKSPLDKL